MNKGWIAGIVLGGALGFVGARVVGKKQEKGVTTAETTTAQSASTNDRKVVIGFSSPGTDHGWLGAVKRHAEEAQNQLPNTEVIITDAQNSAEKQASDVESLIQKKVDVIVMLPFSGKALTPTARKVREAGIPLVVLDRAIESEDYDVFIGGDNRGIGIAAARYLGQQLGGKGKVAEVMGIAGLSVTNDRHEGFVETLKKEFPDVKLVTSLAADFSAEKGLTVTEGILQAHPDINAIYSHDDDMNVGVLQAVKQSGKSNIIVTGAGGSALMMKNIAEGQTPVKASFLYNPSMAGSGIRLARLLALKKGMGDLLELDVPRWITIRAATVVSDNAKNYQKLGY